MNLQTHISSTLTATSPDKLKLDKHIKEVLADVQILARILKYTVAELQSLSIDEIISCIDAQNIELDTVPIDPGLTNLGKINGSATENHILGEGTVYFDILFPVYYQNHSLKILINAEAQASTNANTLHYHLENRIIYYLSRMISAQKNVEFFHTDYDSLKKVYSIWICMDSKENEDAINHLCFTQQTAFGHPLLLPYLDKMQAVIINIREKESLKESRHKLISMLEDLLSKTPFSIKKQTLIEKHGIKMSIELERRITNMGSIGDYLIESAIKEGLERGMAQGMAQGEELFATLMTKLLAAGRNSDAELAAKDIEARKRFYKEFGIID